MDDKENRDFDITFTANVYLHEFSEIAGELIDALPSIDIEGERFYSEDADGNRTYDNDKFSIIVGPIGPDVSNEIVEAVGSILNSYTSEIEFITTG